MTEVGEIFYRQDKYGWLAYDRDGNSARGVSKSHARNNYLLAFGELTNDLFKSQIGFDMRNIDRRLN